MAKQTVRDVVVIDAVRSAIGKSGRDGMKKNGQLCQASAQDLLANTIRGLLDRVHAKSSKFDEMEIENLNVGCLSQIGEQGINIARVVGLLSGMPQEVSASTVNQYCNAGLKAVQMASHEIALGEGDIVVAGGVELMSHYAMGSDVQAAMMAGLPVRLTTRFGDAGMATPQGLCAEIISENGGHTREDLDRYGMWSMQKATQAARKGWHAELIIPFEFEWDGEKKIVDKDETYREKAEDDPEAFMEALAKLPTPFKEDGIVTPGNSSQIVDGAAACILMSADKAEELGLDPICRIAANAVCGGEPVPMLLSPIEASRRAMKRAGVTIDQIDVIEPNEAFVSPLLQFADDLGYDRMDPRQNPTGGAVALGHPIGASGVLYFAEMIHHLKRTGGKYGLQMMCGGGGVAIATVVEAI